MADRGKVNSTSQERGWKVADYRPFPSLGFEEKAVVEYGGPNLPVHGHFCMTENRYCGAFQMSLKQQAPP
jgi:hypothetical protein